ncbi:hypothetical protein BH20ACT6_BH20ACT6_18970 [soil metagenome]
MTTSDPFQVPGAAWVRLGPGLARVRRAVALAVLLALLGALVVAGLVAPERAGWWWSLALVAVVAFALIWVIVGRSVRAWGYAERVEDLVVTRGALWRRIDLVPYGRLQMVDVNAGPLDRLFGLAMVRLHTASPSSRAHIPGLAPEEAARLRDRLTRRGEEQATGL